jgi:2-oxoglutarate dehydrogenase E1 component
MDPYSFLNTAHTAYFAELYDQYLIDPKQVEPSWRAFFQGFEFGNRGNQKRKIQNLKRLISLKIFLKNSK